jgi:hypothetical protein
VAPVSNTARGCWPQRVTRTSTESGCAAKEVFVASRLAGRPTLIGGCVLLSFERPRPVGDPDRVRSFSADLENCTAIQRKRVPHESLTRVVQCRRPYQPPEIEKDHRQDVKGTWWMPWHQESMKGVNGCEKPR